MTIDNLSRSAANLIKLHELAINEKLPDELSEWLKIGIADYLLQGVALENSLGLYDKNRRQSARFQIRLAKRKAYLKAALDLVANQQGARFWTKADLLAKAIKHYEATVWPRHSKRDEPPKGYNELDCHLWHLCKLGRPPTTPNAIWVILENAADSKASKTL